MWQPGTQVPGSDQVKPGLRTMRSAALRPIAWCGDKSKSTPKSWDLRPRLANVIALRFKKTAQLFVPVLVLSEAVLVIEEDGKFASSDSSTSTVASD